ncbi:hypothetical protein NC653_004025 [Populus alba x Populus x berolinensis]|uniref:Uncharacterized protein n=1 Tax=Populus alba x Populus x berolinensis TaxID=444605 RepID=A0AAD6WIW4_9ROSI|nr:hypothetical protein NC653_004025 [Populus alba x Populus x berolinensis]
MSKASPSPGSSSLASHIYSEDEFFSKLKKAKRACTRRTACFNVSSSCFYTYTILYFSAYEQFQITLCMFFISQLHFVGRKICRVICISWIINYVHPYLISFLMDTLDTKRKFPFFVKIIYWYCF